MNKSEFKEKYFSDNFYWVDESNYKQLQEIGLFFGCLCHTKKSQIIEWHDGFKNLGFRTYEKNNGITVYQKEPFLPYESVATDYEDMLSDLENLEDNEIVVENGCVFFGVKNASANS